MDRLDLLKSMIDLSGVGLEIGGSYNPVLRKRDGHRIYLADYASAEELMRIYSNTDIEEVDFVTGGRSLLEVVPFRGELDFIIASHVIEHIPDLLQFIKECEEIMKPGGVLALAIPDKRHCFDLFQPVSSTGDVLQAYYEKRRRHSLARIFDSRAAVVSREGHIVWPCGYSGELRLIHDLTAAHALLKEAALREEYLDAHAWYFVPSSFRLIIRDLAALSLIQLREKVFIDSVGPEFFVGLDKSSNAPLPDRLSLLLSSQKELQSIPAVV